MSITIKTQFCIDRLADVAWPVLTDIEQAAPCFPGAELKEALPDGSYKGAFSVKLGPMTFVFNGKFRIAEQDDANRTALIEASGTDAKGRGGANAKVKIEMADDAATSLVNVVSDVTLSGAVAQYGRGTSMIEALSKQLLDQFARNLSARIAASPVPEAGANLHQAAPAVAAAAPAPVAPLDAGALVRRAAWASIRAFFARLFGGRHHT